MLLNQIYLLVRNLKIVNSRNTIKVAITIWIRGAPVEMQHHLEYAKLKPFQNFAKIWEPAAWLSQRPQLDFLLVPSHDPPLNYVFLNLKYDICHKK